MRTWLKKGKKIIHKIITIDTLIFIAVLTFSSWLMFHTFSYDTHKQSFRIAYRVWSDFGAHIPLIRSFSFGDNISRFLHGTTQYPIFPGEPIRYHFLFYLFVGLLERIGIRIDWALNIPSIFGFTAMVFLVYLLAKTLTKSVAIALLSVLFLLFNGSLGFIYFFNTHGLSINAVKEIVTNSDFPAFAPWGYGLVTAFWNLNIYTNQRHLAAAFTIALCFIFTCIRLLRSTSIKPGLYILIWTILLGILPYFHQPTLLIIAVIMVVYFIEFPKLRTFLLTTGMVSTVFILPQVLLTHGGERLISWYPWYIFHNEYLKLPILQQLTAFSVFWFYNIGIHAILIPIGFFVLPKDTRKLLAIIIPLFIIPNLFKFSVEASANHKFFNFVMMLGNIISANFILWSIQYIWKTSKNVFVKAVSVYTVSMTILFLILSGVVDFFVIYNDVRGYLSDIPSNKPAAWIVTHTPSDAIFLNSSYLYHPASIAGRAVYLGWPYFAWSAGYKEDRMPLMAELYETKDSETMCALLKKYNISFMTAENVHNDENLPEINVDEFITKYYPAYVSDDKSIAIFDVSEICK